MHKSRMFFSIGAFFTPLLVAITTAVHAVGNALHRAIEIAFPEFAARERLDLTARTSEAVTYGAALSRTRAFVARVAQRDQDRQGFGVLGLSAA